MRNLTIILLLVLAATSVSAQEKQKTYYEYNIFSFSNIDEEYLTLDVDNGNTIKKLKDEKGKKISFKTPASALIYLLSLGWEFYYLGESSRRSYQGNSGASTIYWIMRKPCTKEEFENAVKNSINK